MGSQKNLHFAQLAPNKFAKIHQSHHTRGWSCLNHFMDPSSNQEEPNFVHLLCITITFVYDKLEIHKKCLQKGRKSHDIPLKQNKRISKQKGCGDSRSVDF